MSEGSLVPENDDFLAAVVVLTAAVEPMGMVGNGAAVVVIVTMPFGLRGMLV